VRRNAKPTRRHQPSSFASSIDAPQRPTAAQPGTLFPGLKAIGLSTAATRRAWAAFRYRAWHIATLLTLWKQHVTEQPHWQALRYEGYVPIAVDITPYWRPALEGCASKHYHPQAGNALQAIEFGLIGHVGQVNGQRVTLLNDVLRGDLTDASSASLNSQLLKCVATTLAPGQMAACSTNRTP
jgi:hypothetical protein